MTTLVPQIPVTSGHEPGNTIATRPGTERPRSAVWAGRLLLTALFIDLAGTKWASYLPTPVPGLYLPDAVLGASALLATVAMATHVRVRRFGTALAATAVTSIYIVVRLAEAFGSSSTIWSLWIRDMAPLMYVAIIPMLVGAAHAVRFRALLRTVRFASIFMSVTVLGHISGVLNPVDMGTEVAVFTPRPDVDNTVLGLGILAFGGWGTSGRPRRVVQAGFLVLAAMNYSRAGLLAALVCVAVALLRERRQLLGPWVIALLLTAGSVIGLAVLLWPATPGTPPAIAAPEAVVRLMESDLASGTTEARLLAWRHLLAYTQTQGNTFAGAGPASQPVIDSGAVAYLSGSTDVRAPHNWFVGVVAYHGIIGLIAWCVAYGRVLVPRNLQGNSLLPGAAILAYLTASLFGVVIESPFGSLPMAIMAAWMLAHESLPRKTVQRLD